MESLSYAWDSFTMGFPPEMIFMLLGFVVLVLLVTGPGLWSESWGWKWLDKQGKKPAEKAKDQAPKA